MSWYLVLFKGTPLTPGAVTSVQGHLICEDTLASWVDILYMVNIKIALIGDQVLLAFRFHH